MTKGEAFDKAWRRAIQKGDFALYDEIVHPDYESVNHGVKLDKNSSKRVLLKRKGKVIMGPYEVLYENDEFLCIQRFSRVNKYVYISMLSGVHYKFGKVIGQQTMREQLDYDPSEGQDWNWKDYE